jgi:hypothetical protein
VSSSIDAKRWRALPLQRPPFRALQPGRGMGVRIDGTIALVAMVEVLRVNLDTAIVFWRPSARRSSRLIQVASALFHPADNHVILRCIELGEQADEGMDLAIADFQLKSMKSRRGNNRFTGGTPYPL